MSEVLLFIGYTYAVGFFAASLQGFLICKEGYETKALKNALMWPGFALLALVIAGIAMWLVIRDGVRACRKEGV